MLLPPLGGTSIEPGSLLEQKRVTSASTSTQERNPIALSVTWILRWEARVVANLAFRYTYAKFVCESKRALESLKLKLVGKLSFLIFRAFCSALA